MMYFYTQTSASDQYQDRRYYNYYPPSLLCLVRLSQIMTNVCDVF